MRANDLQVRVAVLDAYISQIKRGVGDHPQRFLWEVQKVQTQDWETAADLSIEAAHSPERGILVRHAQASGLHVEVTPDGFSISRR